MYEKNVRREHSRERDFVDKLAKGLGGMFPGAIHVFEDLENECLASKKRMSRGRREKC